MHAAVFLTAHAKLQVATSRFLFCQFHKARGRKEPALHSK